MNKIQENTNNLFQLWKIAGQKFDSFSAINGVENVYIQNTQWPHRTWSEKELKKEDYQSIKSNVSTFGEGVLSYFSELNGKESPSTFFDLVFEQSGMSLVLSQKFELEEELDLIRVNSQDLSEQWSEAFYQSFNYYIISETVFKTMMDIEYLLVKYQNEVVGTVVKWVTGTTCGIHSLGIVPSQRKKGYAKNIMKQFLNTLDRNEIKLVTLQASAAAKNMYAGLGFSYDFKMENYHIK